jgi:hypothetical protein
MNEEEDFKKKFEKANPGIKLTERTKKKTIASAKRLKFALAGMALMIFMGVLSGAPIWVLLIVVPFVGIIGYFGARDSKAIDNFFKDF